MGPRKCYKGRDGVRNKQPIHCDVLLDNVESSLPRKIVKQLVDETLPHFKISASMYELIVNFATEFVEYITAETVEVMLHQEKKNVHQEHIYMALDRLGFAEYRETVRHEFKSKIEAYANGKIRKRIARERILNAGKKEYKLQQKLFRKARRKLAREEQQMAARKEQQVAAREEEQMAAREEEQIAAREEEQIAAREEQQVAVREEEQMAAREEEQIAAREEQQMAAGKEQQVAAREEEQMAAREEEQMAAREEQQMAAGKEQQVAVREEQQIATRKEQQVAAREEQQMAAKLIMK